MVATRAPRSPEKALAILLVGAFAEEAEKELGLVAGGGVEGRLEDADAR